MRVEPKWGHTNTDIMLKQTQKTWVIKVEQDGKYLLVFQWLFFLLIEQADESFCLNSNYPLQKNFRTEPLWWTEKKKFRIIQFFQTH